MRRRLDLAASMILAPEVLFLDEPTTGLDPAGRREVWEAVRTLSSQGTTVLLTTHYLDEADQLCDRITRIADQQPDVDPTAGRFSVPVPDGVAALTALAVEIRNRDIDIADIGLRRPTLDEAFLHLTAENTSTSRKEPA